MHLFSRRCRAMAASSSSSASQPTASAGTMNAELRIANNGIAYSLTQFQEHYGRFWQSRWLEAPTSDGHKEGQLGCAPQPTVKDEHQSQDNSTCLTPAAANVPASSAWTMTAELRTANDGTVFNSSASQPTASAGTLNAQLRIANDGIAYSRTEFQEHYGRFWQSRWWEAPVSDGHKEGQLGGAPQPTVKDEHQSQDNTTSTDTIHLTSAQLEDRPQATGAGGMLAWGKQQELRANALQQGVYEYDLTHSPWPWRDVLRALPQQMRALLTGPGITKFSFRLLRGQPDHNYRNRDSGERHVFEIQHADGARYHLHFHKSGKMDDPIFVPSSGQSEPMGGASQPANGPPCRQVRDVTYKVEDCAVVAKLDMLAPNPPGPVVGRREAHTACITLLQRCAGVQKCAIDITDEQAFPWRRWLINIAEARQTLAVNVVRVFIIRWDCDEEPCITMCREDSTYVCIWPAAQRYATVSNLAVHTDWPSLQILRHPWYVTADWLKVRANAA